MKNLTFAGLSERLFFSSREAAALRGLGLPSARVWLVRRVKDGRLLRLKRDFYVFPEKIKAARSDELFLLANLIQTPSYVSFLSALSYRGWSNQLPQGVVESGNGVRRSRVFRTAELEFIYRYVCPEQYFGFEKENGVFIASGEKALVDCLYLLSLGRYALDEAALDLGRCNWGKVGTILKRYPPRLRLFVKRWQERHEQSRAA